MVDTLTINEKIIPVIEENILIYTIQKKNNVSNLICLFFDTRKNIIAKSGAYRNTFICDLYIISFQVPDLAPGNNKAFVYPDEKVFR